jgi:23S rRNA pseudouridine2605 synthase
VSGSKVVADTLKGRILSEESKRARAQPGPTQKLQKVLAQAGLGSRRDMEALIQAGQVTVNGALARIGARVGPADVVRVGSRVVRVSPQEALPRVLLYHKPEGEIVSHEDPGGRPSVFAKLPPVRGAKWLPVGRLDFNTCGLLIFTTSGEVANRMMHPRYGLKREYAVRVLGQLRDEQRERLRKGIRLDDGTARCESVEFQGGEGANRWYRIVVREGRKRMVRRMFSVLGLTVSRLMRVRFGPVSLPPRLRRGGYVELPPQEVRRLVGMLHAVPEASEEPKAE